VGRVGAGVSGIPTRWVTQIRGQLADAERRLTLAGRRLEEGAGDRALQEAYPGVMGAALARVWLADEAWSRHRTLDEYTHLVRQALPSGFVTLAEMRADARAFAGWRAEDARPLLEEARAFVAAVRAELDRRLAPPAEGAPPR